MLEQLDQVDWANLRHAYGAATDVPDLLRALASDRQQDREEALSGLYSNIWHQGTVYEATAYAVPFLIELLDAPEVGGKGGLLGLLQALATGNSYLAVHQDMDSYYNERRTPEFASRLERELPAVRAAHAAVVEGTPVYLRLLAHADPEIRFTVPDVLAVCEERADVIEPALRDRMTTEADVRVKAKLILCLSGLAQRACRLTPQAAPMNADRHRLLAELMESRQEAPSTRLVAALALAGLAGVRPSPTVEAVLHETLAVALETFDRLPWCGEGWALTVISEMLHGQPDLHLRLLLELLRHPNPRLRADAIYAVEEVCRQWRSAPGLVATALGTLLRDADNDVRRSAAGALSAIGSAARLAVEPLLAALQDRSPEVRADAAVALGKFREERAVPGLLRLLSHPRTRAGALSALHRFGPAAASAVPQLRQLLGGHGDEQIQIRAAHVLGTIGPAARPALPDMIAALHNPAVAAGTAWALGLWGAAAGEAVPDLTTLLAAADNPTRLNAAKALGQIGPAARAAVTTLTILLNDTDASVRAHTALALWQINETAEQAVPVLTAILESQRDGRMLVAQWACSYAAEFLGLMGPSARPAVPLLRAMMTHELHWVRVHSARSLWRIEGKAEELLPVLLQELECRPAGLVVLECLGEMGPLARSAVPALEQIIHSEVRLPKHGAFDSWVDDDEAFAAAAARALERIEPRGSIA
jgi:HEAT repeat protein